MDSQETNLYLAVVTATILICALLGFLVYLLVRQQKMNLQLQRDMALVEISSLEKERARIASDLHDDLGPVLSGIKLRIGLVDPLSVEDQEEINLSLLYLDEAVAKLRTISNNLHPVMLESRGLTEAVKQLISNSADAHKLTIDFEAHLSSPISKDKEVHLFRIIQEGIHNCQKHACASKMKIHLTQEKSMIHLKMIDNGIGLPENTSPSAWAGRGMLSLNNRTQILGGRFQLHSAPDKGTILEFEIPAP